MDRRFYKYEFLSEDEEAKFYTYAIIALNLLYVVLGALMMAAGFYILFDDDYQTYIEELSMQFYLDGVYVLIAAATLVIFLAFFGACGAYMKMRLLLWIFLFLTLSCFILEVVGATYLLVNGITDSRLEVYLEVYIYDLIDIYMYDDSAKRSMDIVQEYIGCCAAYGVLDYIDWRIEVPTTCYDPVTGNAWYKDNYGFVGCVRGVAMFFEGGTGWIAGIALVLAFFQIFGMILAALLLRETHLFKTEFEQRR